MGKLIRAITSDGGVVVYAADTTDMVSQIEKIHVTSAVVTAALGRLITAASLMGVILKGENDSLTLRLRGDGEIGSLIAVANSEGNTKGYVENPVVELPLNNYGKLDVGGAVGKNGILSVVKDIGLKEPFIGQVRLVSGEIAEDITEYYATSEQIPTVCALGVLVNPDLTVKSAGGFLAQLLPGADESTIDKLESSILKLDSVTGMLSSGMSVEQIVGEVLSDFEYEIIDERDVQYKCDCSRDRVERALISMGEQDLTDMANEDKKQQVNCHFCTKKYNFSPEDIKSLIETSK